MLSIDTSAKLRELKNYLKSRKQQKQQKLNWKKYRINYQFGINSYFRRRNAIKTGKRENNTLGRLIKAKKLALKEGIILFEDLDLNKFKSEMFGIISEAYTFFSDDLFESYIDESEYLILIEQLSDIVSKLDSNYFKNEDLEFILLFFQEDLKSFLNEGFDLEEADSLQNILFKI